MSAARLSADAQVISLLCSYLALPKGLAAQTVRPLTPTEWNDVAAVLRDRKLRPGSLLAQNAESIQANLAVNPELAERLSMLLARGGQLAFEVDRLASLGLWTLTRADETYPAMLKEKLGYLAPPVLFGSGNQDLLERGFLAVVGSRDVDAAGEEFAEEAGKACAREGLVLVSGGAKGVDRMSMTAALRSGGKVVGVLAERLEFAVRDPLYRAAIADGRLVLLSAVHPKAPFSTANAMARNKYVYCLARYGLVVSSSEKRGGTWSGASEVLRHRWVPLFVRDGGAAPPGNLALIKRGGLPFPAEVPPEGLASWLESNAMESSSAPKESSRRTEPREGATAMREYDVFPQVWPLIERALEKSPTACELADQLGVLPAQLDAWLKRAASEGLTARNHAEPSHSVAESGPRPMQARLGI